MKRSLAALALVALTTWPLGAAADPIPFKVLGGPSRATFKTDAPLETIVGNTSGQAVSGTLTVDPARPQSATGAIRVDLSTLSTGIAKRDEDMRSAQWLATADEANRYAVFQIKSVEIAGPLVPGKEAPARVFGTLTVKGKPVDLWADARVTYIKLAGAELESQKRFGFTEDNLKVKASFKTTFTNHGMQVPQLLVLKVSNDILIETDLTLVRQ
jgi:polyisoprenoid-binding protein YceI